MSKQCFLKLPNQNARVGNRWDYNSMCQKVPSIINSGADVAIPKGEKEHLFHLTLSGDLLVAAETGCIQSLRQKPK